MDLSHAVTVIESLKFGGMTPMELSDIEQFRFADPRPTYRDIAQILAMLERFGLVRREGIGDSTTSNWRALPEGKNIHSVKELTAAIERKLGEGSELSPLEQAALRLLAEMGGRIDLPTLRNRMPGGPSQETDEMFQALAELQAEGLVAISWGQTEMDWPYLRLTRRGWLRALQSA